jgi:hypothetical protein
MGYGGRNLGGFYERNQTKIAGFRFRIDFSSCSWRSSTIMRFYSADQYKRLIDSHLTLFVVECTWTM